VWMSEQEREAVREEEARKKAERAAERQRQRDAQLAEEGPPSDPGMGGPIPLPGRRVRPPAGFYAQMNNRETSLDDDKSMASLLLTGHF
jgi:hypothetical protein